jgi:hypothetical protein
LGLFRPLWTYANDAGKTTEIRMLKNSVPDTTSGDGTTLYLFENQMLGLGSTATMVSIKNNKVVSLVTKDIAGRYQENRPPYPVELAPPDQEWQYNDRGDDLRLRTSKASCNVDDKVYSDCILVEEKIVAGGTALRTKKSYYAKDIGLVLVTLQSRGENETIYIKLTGCNFADLVSNTNSNYAEI